MATMKDLFTFPNQGSEPIKFMNATYVAGTINATQIVTGDNCVIKTVGNTDYTTVGSSNNNVGQSFTATGTPTGTGTVYLADTGLHGRFKKLKDGNLYTWPVSYGGSGSPQLIMENASRFINHFDSKTGSSRELSMKDFYDNPLVVATKKLIDSETITAANVDTTSALVTVSGAHEFENGMKVTLSGMNNSWSAVNGQDFFASNVSNASNGTLKLRAGSASGPYVRFYNLEDASITAATAANPAVFTDASHDLTTGTSVRLSGFDGSLATYNGADLFAKVIDSSTFNLTFDSAGNNLVGLQAAINDISIDEFRLQSDFSITMKATNSPQLANGSEISFDTGGSTLQQELRSYQTANANLYVQATGTAHEYKLFKNSGLTTAFNWSSDLTTTDFDIERTTTTSNPVVEINHTPAPSINPLKIPETNSSITDLKALNGNTALAGFSKTTVYFTDGAGHVYATESGASTGNTNNAVEAGTFELPTRKIFRGYANAGSEAVLNVPTSTDQGGTLGANSVVVDVSGYSTTAKADIPNRSYRLFNNGSIDVNVGTLTATSDTILGHAVYTANTNGVHEQASTTLTNIKKSITSDYGIVDPGGMPSATVANDFTGVTGLKLIYIRNNSSNNNTLFNALNDANNLTGGNGSRCIGRVFIGSTATNSYGNIGKMCYIPTSKQTDSGGLDFFWCLAYSLDGNNIPSLPATTTTVSNLDTTNPFHSSLVQGPQTNFTSSADTFQYYQDGNKIRITVASQSTAYPSGTIVTLNSNEYVIWFARTHNDGTHNAHEYLYVPYDSTKSYDNDELPIDFTTVGQSVGGTSSSLATGSTNQVNYFKIDNSGLRQGFFNATRNVFDVFYGQGISYVTLDPTTYSGSTVDVVGATLTNSTTGTVLENRTAADAGQIQVADLSAATTGTIAPASSEPYRYEIDTVTMYLPGNQKYTFQNTSNVTTAGARVKTTSYFDSGATSETTYASTGETAAQFSAAVDSSGYLTGVTLTEEVDAEGRYADADPIMLLIESQDDTYAPRAATTAESEDVFNTQDYWVDPSFNSLKVWPDHVGPSSAKIVQNHPSTTTVSQNGTKFVRTSGFTKWQLEVEYPPLTKDQFLQFQAVANAVQGQNIPFQFNNKNADNTPIIFNCNFTNTGADTNVELVEKASLGDSVLKFGGFDSNQTKAFNKGEVVIFDSNNNNSQYNVCVHDADANEYGEVKVRFAYPITRAYDTGKTCFKNPAHIHVTLAADEFEYTIGTNGYYYLVCKFDLDEYK